MDFGYEYNIVNVNLICKFKWIWQTVLSLKYIKGLEWKWYKSALFVKFNMAVWEVNYRMASFDLRKNEDNSSKNTIKDRYKVGGRAIKVLWYTTIED